MNPNNELENLILTICPHEQANCKEKTRVMAIEAWARKYGIADIEHRELKLCDYSLVGEFRDRDINLGIEYKAWDNFLSDPTDDMEDKITRSQEIYYQVAFFVEAGNYSFKPNEDNGHATLQFSEIAKAGFRKKGMKETEIPMTKTLAGFEGFLETMSLNGIHVRQLRSEAQFPYSVYNLLIYLTNEHKLKVKEQSYENWLQNHYMTLPEIGYVRAKKLILNYPNPAWICAAAEESLIDVLGKTTGRVIWQHLHSHSLESDAWKQGFHTDGTRREDSNICEFVTCQDPKMKKLPCEVFGFSKTCKYPDLKRKIMNEREAQLQSKSAKIEELKTHLVDPEGQYTVIPSKYPFQTKENPDQLDLYYWCTHCQMYILRSYAQYHLSTYNAARAKEGHKFKTLFSALFRDPENKKDPMIKPAENKPMSEADKKHQDFKLWKAKGFKDEFPRRCSTCQFFNQKPNGIICSKFPAKRIEESTNSCCGYYILKTIPSHLTEVSNISPFNTSVSDPPSHALKEKFNPPPLELAPLKSLGADTSGQYDTSKGSPDVYIECVECGDNSNYVLINPKTLLCGACQEQADNERKGYNIEIAKEIIKYLSGFPEGLDPQSICDNFDCSESSSDKKDLLICIKKMAQIGLITSKCKGLFTVTPEGLTFAGLTNISQSLNTGHISGNEGVKSGVHDVRQDIHQAAVVTSGQTCCNPDNLQSSSNPIPPGTPDLQETAQILSIDSPLSSAAPVAEEGKVNTIQTPPSLPIKACKNINCLNDAVPNSEYCEDSKCIEERKCQEADKIIIIGKNSPEFVKAELDKPEHFKKTPKNTKKFKKTESEPIIKEESKPDLNITQTLESCLHSWFDTAHSLQETVKEHSVYGTGTVAVKVIEMENKGALRRFSEKGTMMWIHAVGADKESEIGV